MTLHNFVLRFKLVGGGDGGKDATFVGPATNSFGDETTNESFGHDSLLVQGRERREALKLVLFTHLDD